MDMDLYAFCLQGVEKNDQLNQFFNNPYAALLLDGGAAWSHRPEVELVAILSSN